MVEKEELDRNKQGKGTNPPASVFSWVTLVSTHLVKDSCGGDTRTVCDGLRYGVECLGECFSSGEGDSWF